MQIVRSLNETSWRIFINEHPKSNIYHTPEIFQVFTKAKGFQPSLWAVVDRDQRPLALLLPVQVTLTDGLMRYLTTRAVTYGSVLCVSTYEGRDALEMLLQSYKQEAGKAVLFTELRNVSDMGSLQPILEKCAFRYEDHLNYLIDLKRTPDVMLQGLGRRTRKRLRRALRQDKVLITEVSQREQVSTCYRLFLKSYGAAQVPLAHHSLFEAAFDVLYPKGMVKFLLAWIGNKCVAGAAELIYKDTIYGWYSGVNRDFSSYVPNELLTWHILQWGAENGYELYDFGGAGKPDEEYGVRDFKAKFGGELVCYGRNTFVHAPVRLEISKLGYQVFRYLKKLRN
jgi:lipid II:glycine glycyltransferase (peptidoglycan interpeptide bridge formation enzyme)